MWLCETLLLAPSDDDYVPPRRRAHELPARDSAAPSAAPTLDDSDGVGARAPAALAKIFTVQRDETQLLSDWLRRALARAPR